MKDSVSVGTERAAETQQAHRGLALLTLCIGVLLAQVDTSVVNLAMRPIGEYFGAGVAALQWVVDSYNLIYAVLLLTGGLLADLYGRRLTLIAGTVIFTGASLICGFAPSISVLIGARGLAGIGAALLLPASLAIIRVLWIDERERGRALGIWAACNGLALAIGPTVGGCLIRQLGWRSIFFVVVPLGLAAMLLAISALPESSDPQERSFDAAGQLLGAVALGSLAVAAIELHSMLWIALIALPLACLTFVLFVAVEARQGSRALVPFDIFRARQFRGAVVATTGMTFGMYGVLFLVPLTWQSTGRLDAVGAGFALMPMALLFVLVSPFSGPINSLLGMRVMTTGGVAVIGAGLIALGLGASSGSLIPAEIGISLTGAGMGLATGPLMEAAVGSVVPQRSGTAAALINVARMAGATIGVAVLGTVFALGGSGIGGLQVAMLMGGL